MNRIGKIIGAAAVLAMALAGSGPSMALPSKAYYRMYFQDPAHQIWAGTVTLGCSGAWLVEGERTPYYIVIDEVDCTTPYDCEWANFNGTYVCLGV